MKYDENRIKQRFFELQEALEGIYLMSNLPWEDFEKPNMISTTKYNLTVAIESVEILSDHLINQNELCTQKSDIDPFKALLDAGFISEGLYEKMEDMTTLESRLVLTPEEVKDEELYHELKGVQIVIEEFISSFNRAMGKPA